MRSNWYTSCLLMIVGTALPFAYYLQKKIITKQLSKVSSSPWIKRRKEGKNDCKIRISPPYHHSISSKKPEKTFFKIRRKGIKKIGLKFFFTPT